MHVAAEISFWEDPLLMRLARLLGKPLGLAGSYVLRWRQFVLLKGHEDGSGRVERKYSIVHVAAYVDWRGTPTKLAKAMIETGFMGSRKGRLFYPNWKDIPTGKYVVGLAEDRKRKKAARDAARGEKSNEGVAGQTPDVRGTSGGQGADVQSQSERKKEERHPDGAPTDSPQGGEGVAFGWNDFWDFYPTRRRRNQDATRRRFDELTHAQRVGLGLAFPRHLDIWRGKKDRRVPFSDVYLRDEHWAEMLRDRVPTLAKPKAATPAPDPEAGRRQEINHRRMVRFDEIKRELATRNVHRSEIRDKAMELLDREWPADLDEPLPPLAPPPGGGN